MKRINEIDKPIVGHKYLVPCFANDVDDWLARQAGPKSFFLHDAWLPILYCEGSHADPELGVENQHLHYDSRFISGHKLVNIGGFHFTTAVIQNLYIQWSWEELESEGLIQWRSRKCFRREQVFPQTNRFNEKIVTPLEDKYRDSQIQKDWICPHRRICLKGHPVKDFDGRKGITCPGHGLTWDIDTHQLISNG